jgi:hypothetical protein
MPGVPCLTQPKEQFFRRHRSIVYFSSFHHFTSAKPFNFYLLLFDLFGLEAIGADEVWDAAEAHLKRNNFRKSALALFEDVK